MEQYLRDNFLTQSERDLAKNIGKSRCAINGRARKLKLKLPREIYEQVKKLDLATVLMENINTLKSNPGFVKQATVINNSINTLLNAVKTEILVKKLR